MIGNKEEQYNLIYNAVSQCGIFIFFVTKNSVNGKWPIQELKMAMDAKKQNPDMVLLPLFYQTTPNEALNLISPRTESLFSGFSAKSLLQNLKNYSGIQYPRSPVTETFNQFVYLVLQGVVTNTLTLEPFHKFRLNQTSSLSDQVLSPTDIIEKERFEVIKKQINECNTPVELSKLWKEVINPCRTNLLQLLMGNVDPFKWSLSLLHQK